MPVVRANLTVEQMLVFHTVDEKGTEAAAVTGFQVRLMAAAVPPREIRFIADHPFMFAIIDKKHKNILFMGRFTG
ncbi:unnamed protein product [Soboliphyme baturini]|uniref:SERPIN domain-containing protein n=1 Tax=Soboliphyme baturini TaxID=241478 RepID=A0A183J2D5_9BILA|nr:unnamed protein product [Soboliphyme baturini]